MAPRIAFFGTPKFSVPILQSIHQTFPISVVVSQPSKPVGKGQRLSHSAVGQYALKHDLPLITPTSLKDPQFKTQLLQHSADLAIVVAYGKILPQWILEWPKHGAINIHASLLPKHRGASPIAASILAGDEITGLTYIAMNSKMDEGDIIYTSESTIEEHETMESLSIKLSTKASKDINNIIVDFLNNKLPLTPQNHSQATYSTMQAKDDGLIDFNNPPADLERKIRAYHPWPGVWGEYKGKRVKLLPNGLIQMEGKKPTPIANFLNGYPDFPSTIIGLLKKQSQQTASS